MGDPGPTDLGHSQRSRGLLLIKAGTWTWQATWVSSCVLGESHLSWCFLISCDWKEMFTYCISILNLTNYHKLDSFTEMCSCEVLEARSLKSTASRACSPKAPGEKCPLPFSSFLGSLTILGIPWLTGASLQPQPLLSHGLLSVYLCFLFF